MPRQKDSSRYIPKSVKDAVRRRDGDICRECGRHTEYPEFDHITPHSLGGPHTVDNLRILCRRCNLKKGNKTPKCSKCDNWIPHNANFCHHCGKPLEQLSNDLTLPDPASPISKGYVAPQDDETLGLPEIIIALTILGILICAAILIWAYFRY